jgi:hypothetical protein
MWVERDYTHFNPPPGYTRVLSVSLSSHPVRMDVMENALPNFGTTAAFSWQDLASK